MKKLLLGLLVVLGLAIGLTAYAVNVTIPQSTQLGDLATGKTSGNYQLLHPGANGTCLIASSTSASGLIWSSCSGAGGLTSFAGMTGPAITVATGSDTNILLNITTGGNNATFTPAFTGTLAAGRLNSNVVQGVTNDTNLQGSISAQNLTLAWAGVLSVARGGTATNTLGNLTLGSNLSFTSGDGKLSLIGTSTQISLGSSVVTTLATGTAGNIFNGSIGSNTLTLNLPFASAANTGQLQAADWKTFNNKIGTSTSLTTNAIPIVTGANTLGNSSLTQSAGTTLINGTTPIIDGGGDWLNNVIQGSGANFIVQSPTSSLVGGNVTQQGGVAFYNSTQYLTAAQFCNGGLEYGASTVPFSTFFPTLTQIGTSPCGNTQPWSSGLSQQFAVNGGSAAWTISPSGTNETALYAPGSGPTIYPGQSAFTQGEFTASSTIQGATTTGMSFNFYLQAFQPTSTAPSTMGQLLTADATGHGWQLTNLVAGANVTITTTTPGQLTIAAASGGGSGNSAWTIGNGLIFNATSSDSVLVGTSTPTVSTVFIQGTGTKQALTIASSSGSTVFNVDGSGGIIAATNQFVVASSTGNITRIGNFSVNLSSTSLQLSNSGGDVLLQNNNGSANSGLLLQSGGTKAITSSIKFNVGGTEQARVNGLGYFLIGTTTPSGSLYVQGTTTVPALIIASSTGNTLLQVAANGSTTLSSLGTGNVCSSGGSFYNCTVAGGSGNSAWTIGNALIYNATSTDSVLVGTTTPTTAAFYLQGSGSKNPFTVASSTGTQLLSVLVNGNVGIGSSSPVAALSVQGAGTATLLFAIASSTGQQYLTVDGTAGNCVTTGLCLNTLNSASQALFTVDGNGKVVASSTITGTAWLGGGTTPTFATSTGAGTGAGVTATGSNCSNSNCYVTVSSGTAPVANQIIFTETFSTSYTNAPNCQISMASNTAGSLLVVGNTTTTSTLKIMTSTALTASKQYGFYVWCPSN